MTNTTFNIIVNDEVVECEANSSVLKMLENLSLESLEGMAVAVNNEVIHKTQWETHILQENDKVIIIRATQGG